jgi:3-oxoacyl-[acyl-carrier-protein] synthase-3
MNHTMRAEILGSGSYLPANEVDNATLLRFLGINRDPRLLYKIFGIEQRRLGFDFVNGCRPPEFLSDTDLAENAVRAALADAALAADSIDHLVYVTSTPDKLHFMHAAIELHRRLGLRRSVRVDHLDCGCAGLAKAFEMANAYLQAGYTRRTLVVASNTPSAFFVVARPRYVTGDHWLSAAVFGDGAGAVVLGATADGAAGLQQVFYEVDGALPLFDYPAGGALQPTTADNANDHLFLMDAANVREQFPAMMRRNLEGLGLTGNPDRLAQAKRIYIHQANRWLVEGFAHTAGLAADKVPINLDRYGNTSAASTLLLLDEDRKAGRIGSGDTAIFLWLGAGLMHGGAIIQL